VSTRGWASFAVIRKATNTFLDVDTDRAVVNLVDEVILGWLT